MKLVDQISHAFGIRKSPDPAAPAGSDVTPEQKDARWFSGKHWSELTHKDWDMHPDATFTFTPEAFRFYLPSLLTISTDAKSQPLHAVESLLGRR